MKNIYLKTFVGIIVGLWIIYFFHMWQTSRTNKSKCNCSNNVSEGFTPKINATVRPYIRSANQKYDKIMRDYGPSAISHKLKKLNIF